MIALHVGHGNDLVVFPTTPTTRLLVNVIIDGISKTN